MNYNRNHAPRVPMYWPLGLLAWLLLFLTSTVQAAGPTGLLNDTGQTQCFDGSAMVACSSANTSDASAYPRQDGRFGRDAASPPKIGSGAAGFDFTKVCMDGTLNCTGAANVGARPAATDWACTKDNVTNLIWSLESNHGLYDPSSLANSTNAVSRCGFNSGWRLPTLLELMAIVHNGVTTAVGSPKIDTNFFPGTVGDQYWTGSYRAPAFWWTVNFSDGSSIPGFTSTSYDNNGNVVALPLSAYFRLVRNGP